MSNVFVIGLVGGIGSGKSTVARELARLGAEVLDADGMVHELLCEKPTVRKVVQRFGDDVLDEAGGINRKKLGAAAFASTKGVRDLEAILHPSVIARTGKHIRKLRQKKTPAVVVIDAPLLVEAGMERMCDEIVFVHVPKLERCKRLRETRGWTRAEVEKREKHQKPLTVKRRKADIVIRNGISVAALRIQVRDYWKHVQQCLTG